MREDQQGTAVYGHLTRNGAATAGLIALATGLDLLVVREILATPVGGGLVVAVRLGQAGEPQYSPFL